MTAKQVCDILGGYQQRRKPIAMDIEGNCNWITCYSIADSACASVVVPFIHPDGTSVWEEADEVAIWEATNKLFSDPLVPKILQNALFDCFVLAWSYGILVRGLQDDTMLKHFELYAELEKSLGFQASIYTKEPFYKADRKSTDERTQLEYCAKDSMVTYECNVAQDAKLMPRQREHYQFNMQLLQPLLFMELRGIKYNYEESQQRLGATYKRIASLQDRINREAASSRPALAAFFAALTGPMAECYDMAKRPDGSALELECQQGAMGQAVITILAAAFCLADPRERRVCDEVTWQPMRWQGCAKGKHAPGRWVKAGKRLTTEAERQAAVAACAWQGNNPPALIATDKGTWLKPVTKQVERSCKVAVATLEDVKRFAKDSCKADCKRALSLLGTVQSQGGCWLPAQRGELASLLGLSVKVNATGAGRPTTEQAAGIEKDANWLLYECWGLPKQFIKEGNRLTTRLASDDHSVIKAWVATKDRRALWFLNLRRLLTSTKSLRAAPDDDGRIRCSYNLVGTDTHRLACYGTPTGSSTLNLQTVTKDHRSLYLADEGCYLCQRDLSGADGWTVAAYCAMLGDTTMLDDYRARLKPAQILTLMMDRGAAAVNAMTRDELRPLCKPITEESDWRYFANKRTQHGGCYLVGKFTSSDQILTDSFKKTGKPIYVPPAQCEQLIKGGLFVRYPGVPRMHAYWAQVLMDKGEVTASNGFTRRFYGRKVEWRKVKSPAQETLRKLVAHLPQVYTTYATTLALHRLWVDADNRLPSGGLRIEPLHTVHDSLLTQFQQVILEWASAKLKDYFDNELLIATTKLVIPASGTYGPSWGCQPHEL